MLWQVTTRNGVIDFGGTKRAMLTATGCNEPFRDRYWCPRKGWFMSAPCPFINRHECGAFHRMVM